MNITASPKVCPGLRISTTFSLPSADVKASLIWPARIRWKPVQVSPRWNRISPFGTLTSRTPRAMRATSLLDKPLNSGACVSRPLRRSISGVLAAGTAAVPIASRLSLQGRSQWLIASSRQLGIEHGESGRQLVRLADHGKARRAEQVRQVAGTFAVYGHAEGHDAAAPRLDDGDPGGLDAVAAVVKIEIVRLAVRQDEQDAP